MSGDLVLLLPSDVWLEIASFLTVYSDLLNFTCTCKFFHSLLQRTPSLWNHFVPYLQHCHTVETPPMSFFLRCAIFKDNFLLTIGENLFRWDVVEPPKLSFIRSLKKMVTSLAVLKDKVMFTIGDQVYSWDDEQGKVKFHIDASPSILGVHQDMLVVKERGSDNVKLWKESEGQFQCLHTIQMNEVSKMISWKDLLVISCFEKVLLWKDGEVVKEIDCKNQGMLCVWRDELVTAELFNPLISFWTVEGEFLHNVECERRVKDLMAWNETLLSIHMDSSYNFCVIFWSLKKNPLVEVQLSGNGYVEFVYWTLWRDQLVIILTQNSFNGKKLTRCIWKDHIKASLTMPHTDNHLRIECTDLKQQSKEVFPPLVAEEKK